MESAGGGMESERSDEWNQADEHAAPKGLMPYQASFVGLDIKSASRFLCPLRRALAEQKPCPSPLRRALAEQKPRLGKSPAQARCEGSRGAEIVRGEAHREAEAQA
jgi:hypothetical protein